MVTGLLRTAACIALGSAAALAVAGRAPASTSTIVRAVGAENFYANVIEQIGGRHVVASSILSDPNTDPHAYESSTRDASAVAGANLVVQNGIGYDDFMPSLERASPNPQRAVIDVGVLMGRKKGDNPHLWYAPATMPKVAAAIEAQLARDDPADAGEFRSNLRTFEASLRPWTAKIAQLRRTYAGVPVAVTEPVFNYTLAAIGASVRTPRSFQLAIEEGNDPAPQDVQIERSLLSSHAVKAFIYNQQTIEPSTSMLLALAHSAHVPVVGVYETMPISKNYQGWMIAEVDAVETALARGVSTDTIR